MRGNSCVTGLPSAKASKTPRITGSIARENVVLRDEAHLHVELVELARQPVGARVLVAEAWRDLEIAVEARHHDELLELLRRLRQRVEFSRMQPRRHQKVARALRRGGGQDRRLELVEAGGAHQLAHLRHDRDAAHDVAVQRLAAQIEEAVFEPRVLRIIRLAENRQRQLRRLRKNLDLAREDLDLAGRQIGVQRVRRAGCGPRRRPGCTIRRAPARRRRRPANPGRRRSGSGRNGRAGR